MGQIRFKRTSADLSPSRFRPRRDRPRSSGSTYLSNFDFFLEGIAFSVDTNLFSFSSIDTVETCSTIIFSLTWNTLATSFSFLDFWISTESPGPVIPVSGPSEGSLTE